jgi:hypothetical protein
MQDDETDLEHILRLDVRWRRHAGQTSLRGWILDRCRLGSQAVSQDFCESFLETVGVAGVQIMGSFCGSLG